MANVEGSGSGSDATWVTFLDRADIACYDAKSKGGNTVQMHRADGSMQKRATGTHRD